MKHLILFFALFSGGFLPATAQWSDDPQVNNRITEGKPTYHEFEALKDGSVRFLFLYPPLAERKTFLQSLDSEGIKQFPDTGKLVVAGERTWVTIWVDDRLFVDSEGNSIIAVTDLRHSSTNGVSYTLYKVSPTGEHLWSENGIDLNGGITRDLVSRLGAIQLEDGSYIFTWTSAQGSAKQFVELQRLSKDGAFLWEDNVVLRADGVAVDYPRLVNAGNNQFILVYTREKAIVARKFDSSGASLWASDAAIYNGANFPSTVSLHTIINVEAGPDGSAFVGWHDYRLSGNKETPYIAHVKTDGTLGFLATVDGERLSYSANRVFSPKMVYDAETNSVHVAFRETNNGQTSQWVVIQKIELDGNLPWGADGIRIDNVSGTQANVPEYSIRAAGEGRFAAFYLLQSGTRTVPGRVALIDGETGGYVWENEKVTFSSVDGAKSDLRTSPPADDQSWTVSWLEARGSEPVGNPSVYVQRINFDGTLGARVIPSCVAPSNLQADGITAASVSLSWEADAANTGWDLRYALAPEDGDPAYTTVDGLEATSYLLEGLEAETAYVWGVRASCEGIDPSGYTEGAGFATLPEDVGMDGIERGAWSVFASGKAINIVNPGRSTIERIRLYDLNGALLKDYGVRTNENVLITAAPDRSAVVVRIDGSEKSVTVKVAVR